MSFMGHRSFDLSEVFFISVNISRYVLIMPRTRFRVDPLHSFKFISILVFTYYPNVMQIVKAE